MKSPVHQRPAQGAFSLIEVVAAVGIFALSMVAVIGLFAPVAKSVSSAVDAEAATNVASLLTDYLRRQPFESVDARLKNSTGATTHQLTDADNAPGTNAADPRLDAQLLFASLDGSKIGAYNDPVWNVAATAGAQALPRDDEKYFEIALIRHEAVSPPQTTTTADDGTVTIINPVADARFLGYTARIRWPAFVPDPATNTVTGRRALPAGFNQTGTLRFDNSQKQVLFVTGSVTR